MSLRERSRTGSARSAASRRRRSGAAEIAASRPEGSPYLAVDLVERTRWRFFFLFYWLVHATGNGWATEDTPLSVNVASGVLANDTDVDGDTLTAVLVTGPAHGSLTLNADGSSLTRRRQLQRPRQLHLQGQRRPARLATSPR